MARKIVFASGKGGVGKTTLTVAVGKALAERGQKVLLVDFDDLRGIDLLVGASEAVVYDWGDVLLGRCSVEEAIYKADGLSVMSCPRKYGEATPKKVRELIGSLDKRFDYILFDAPAGIGRGMQLAAAAADKGVLVATPDYVCVRGAFTAADELAECGVGEVRMIINRAVKKAIRQKKMLNIDAVIDSTAVQLLGIVPEDPYLRFGAMGVSVYKKGQASYNAIKNIAKRLCGENVQLSFT